MRSFDRAGPHTSRSAPLKITKSMIVTQVGVHVQHPDELALLAVAPSALGFGQPASGAQHTARMMIFRTSRECGSSSTSPIQAAASARSGERGFGVSQSDAAISVM